MRSKRKPLRKPMKGWSLRIMGLLIHFNFARSLLWASDSEKTGVRRTQLIDLSIVEKEGLNALSFVLGPFKIMMGLTK